MPAGGQKNKTMANFHSSVTTTVDPQSVVTPIQPVRKRQTNSQPRRATAPYQPNPNLLPPPDDNSALKFNEVRDELRSCKSRLQKAEADLFRKEKQLEESREQNLLLLSTKKDGENALIAGLRKQLKQLKNEARKRDLHIS